MQRNVSLLVFSFIFLFLSSSFAQTAKMSIVGKPHKSSSEFSGVRDSNGRLCAMFKIISDMDGFSYDSNNGIVKVDDNPGEDHVYVSPDERVLKIFKSGYEPLQIILSEYGIQLKQKEVWRIEIKGRAKTGSLLPVTIFAQPQGANITIDGKSVQSGKAVELSKGSHRLLIKNDGFKTVNKTITVSKNNVVFNEILIEVELEQVLIKSVPAEARIYVNGVDEGLTDRGIWKYPGQYQLKLSKTGYVEINKTITVTEGSNNTFSYTLDKNSGSLQLTVSPANVSVLINKKDYSNRSQIELAPGRYKIEISKNGYNPQSETVTIQRGQILSKTYSLTAKTGKLQFNIQPLTAKVTLKQNGQTLQSWTGMKYLKKLQVGTYDLECTASGYGTETKRITIEERRTAVLDVKLDKSYRASIPARDGSGSTSGDMVFIKGRTFQMGDTFNEGSNDEKPVHRVTVSDFYMSKYEVTFAQYDKFCEATGRKKPSDSGWGRGSRPVINVSWNDATAFCKWKGGRLPTEAEWEYAAREGGRKVRFGSGKDIADPSEINFDGSSKYKKPYSRTGVYRKKTTPAGSFKPNALGLYDMSGNVWEWCSDWYGKDYYRNTPQSNPKGPSSGSSRVLRGGSWYIRPDFARAADRYSGDPYGSSDYYGFRFVKDFSAGSTTSSTSSETGTMTDIDGNVYKTVKIGKQIWMAENLKVTRYRNGDPIPNVTGKTEWKNLKTGAYCNYDNNLSNAATYGRLYNWYTVNDRRNIAPAGWHVPTDEEWKKLEMYLGMSQSNANEIYWRGSDEGGKLKERGTTHWKSPNKGAANSSGFTALPGGYRSRDGAFDPGLIGNRGADYWSATQRNSLDAWYRSLHCNNSDVFRDYYYKQIGYSVRLVRD